MAPKPAVIWQFYEKANEKGERKCKFCNDTEQNSSNAEKHTMRNHPDQFKFLFKNNEV
jgi:hypothetical protein